MPLTSKGEEILSAMKKEYGAAEGERVFYASKNAGVISGVDSDEAMPQMMLDTMAEQIASLGSEAKRLVERMDGSSDVKIIHNKLLGGWYVVRGPHQTPLSGRFNSKTEAETWLKNRGDAASISWAQFERKYSDWETIRASDNRNGSWTYQLRNPNNGRVQEVTVKDVPRGDSARADWNAFSSYHIDDLRRWVKEGKLDADKLAKVQKEIAERESGASKQKVTPQIAPGWVNGMPPRGGQR